jgi:hypothetical protein
MAKSKDQRYVVAPGVSFVGNKRAYVAGEEIDESAFSDPKYFKAFLSGKSPRIIPAPPEPEVKTDKESGKNNVPPVPPSREAMEEKALSVGATLAELAALDDNDLVEFLKNKGIE